MNVITKDATITNTDEEFPGSFEVVLSTPAKDRDGDELATDDWKQPLPDHITFDMDHGMSVEKTVGSGVPSIEDGKLIVRGTYSSLPRAQEVRTLVKEGHIRTTSVAFLSEKTVKDGKSRTVRELLNGAFVAIPANREAVVLAAKGLKAGARHNQADMGHIQAIYEHAVALGAGPMDDTGAAEGTMGGRSMMSVDEVALRVFGATGQPVVEFKAKYDAETMRRMMADGEAYRGPDGSPSYPIGDKEDLANAIRAVGRGGADHDKIRAYIMRRARALGASDSIPDNWNADGSLKALSGDVTTKATDPDNDPGALAQAVDAALDEAQNLLDGVDVTTLPEPVQQAIALITSADNAVDELLDVLGVADPDEDDEDENVQTAPAAALRAAPAADTDELDLQNRLIALRVIAAAG